MAKTALAEKQPETARKIRLSPAKFQRLEFGITQHKAVLDAGHTMEDAMNPDYWGHVARKVKSDDLIYCRDDKKTFFAILWVVDRADSWIQLRPIIHKTFDQAEDTVQTTDPDLYTIDKNESGWRVFHKENKTIIASNLATEAAAKHALAMYINK